MCIIPHRQLFQISQESIRTKFKISAVLIISRSQTAHRRVKIKKFAFKGTITRNPFRGEHIFHERKDLRYKMLIYYAINFDTAVSCTPRSRIFELISRRNRNRIRKYLSLIIRGLDGFESSKNGGKKSRDTHPLRSKKGIFQTRFSTTSSLISNF